MSDLEQLQTASESIRSFVENSADVDSDHGFTFEDVSHISEQVARIGQRLSGGSLLNNRSDNVKAGLVDYRINLERLGAAIAVIEERLRSEREGLIKQHQHLSVLGRWAANTKDIR
jgi:hypothetical protein